MSRRSLTSVSASGLLRGCLGWWRQTPTNLNSFRVSSLLGTEVLFNATTGNATTFSRNMNIIRHPGGYGAWPCSSSSSLYQYCGTTLAASVQDHTIAAWVYTNDSTSGQMLCSRATNITVAGYEWRLMPQFGYAYFGTGTNGFYNGPTLSAATWTHVVGTWNQSAGSLNLYTAGVLQNTVATATEAITHGGSDAFLWGNQVQNQILSGYLDDLVVWNRVLSASEAFAWYRSSTEGHARLLFLGDDPATGVPPPTALGTGKILVPYGSTSPHAPCRLQGTTQGIIGFPS